MSGEDGTGGPRKVSVGLSFDVDAEAAWMGSLRTTTPSSLSRGTYAVNEGLPRVLAFLAARRLSATFFVPGYTAELHPDAIRLIVDSGHELGHHGYFHEKPSELEEAVERNELLRGLEALDAITGVRPVGYRAPGWELSEQSLSLLCSLGFEYDSSMFAWERPYWIDIPGSEPRLVEVPSSWELCDATYFFYARIPGRASVLSAPTAVEEIWCSEFDGMYAAGDDRCYILTMHPDMIGRHHRLAILDRLLVHMSERDGVHFATLGEIAGDFRARPAS
jgi:peptidoglycan/xylan/chitin deacetylase (PgdA/CDA1 family)